MNSSELIIRGPEKEEHEKIAIFDLDDTLIDTAKMKEDIAKILGMEPGEYLEDYMSRYDTKTGMLYNFLDHLEQLSSEGKIVLEKEEILEKKVMSMKEQYDILLSKASDYIFPGAEAKLEEYAGKKCWIVLATKGDEHTQLMKINSLWPQIGKFFNDVIIIDTDKTEALKNLLSGKDVTFINDKHSENASIVEQFPGVKVFHPKEAGILDDKGAINESA